MSRLSAAMCFVVTVVLSSGPLPLAARKLRPRRYEWLPLSDIKPRGWLFVQQQIQAETLCGHLQSFFVNGSQWIGGNRSLKQGYELLETVPYWLYGLVPLAVQLGDERLLSVARSFISAIIDLQGTDGWMGPFNVSDDTLMSPFPRYRLLGALMDYAEAFAPEHNRTMLSMRRLVQRIHLQLHALSESEMRRRYPWAHARWQELVIRLQALMDRDASFWDHEELFDAMDMAMQKGLDWFSWFSSPACANASDTHCFPCRHTKSAECRFSGNQYYCEHGVNVAQALPIWGTTWRLGRRDNAAAETAAAIERLDFCHGQPGAVWSSHEVLDGVESNRGTETCAIVEAMDSHAEIFTHFGDIRYLDRLEAIAFNRLPAAYFNGSMWALEYFHQTNTMGWCNDYTLQFECCTANGNQGWPRFTRHLYARGPDGGLVVSLYAPSFVETVLVANRSTVANRVRVLLDTQYPFDEELNFSIDADLPFPLSLRIPEWAQGVVVKVVPCDGQQYQEKPRPGTFHVLQINSSRSLVRLTLPIVPRLHYEQAGGVSVHAGPLLFAVDLRPQEEKSKDCYFPPHGCAVEHIRNAVDWRRALVLDEDEPPQHSLIIERSVLPRNFSGHPFSRAQVPVRIRAMSAPILSNAWHTVNCTSMEDKCHECVGPIPSLASEREVGHVEPVLLIPFGATDVRMTVLPVVWRRSRDMRRAARATTGRDQERLWL